MGGGGTGADREGREGADVKRLLTRLTPLTPMQIPRKGEAKKVILNSELVKNRKGKGGWGRQTEEEEEEGEASAAGVKSQDSPASRAWTCLPERPAGLGRGLWVFPEDRNASEKVKGKGYKPLM